VIRATLPEDTPGLLALADETAMFKPSEIQALREVLDDYHGSNQALGHQCVTLEEDSRIVAFAYYAPASMTDRTWYLYWIAVRKGAQARGVGGTLLRHVEDDIGRRHQGRMLLIETSSLPHYALTRRFYLKHGCDMLAVLGDYYADGDDMVVFRKRLGPANKNVSPPASHGVAHHHEPPSSETREL
jgi:ribosomal protein S18 acetylase RimI-like enzyme